MKSFIKHKLDDIGTINKQDILKKIEGYDYVSFDIFDTLIKRDVPKPIDVFMIMEKLYNLDGFYQERILAEKRARTNSPEVTLDKIYNYFKVNYNSFDIKEIEDLEKKTEEELCTINENMREIYEYCLINNKKIIIISDMYLDRLTIENILKKNNIDKYDKLYISNEINITKASGELYKYVIKDLNITPEEIIHIGNDIKADYLSAKKNHIKAIKIPTYFNKEFYSDKHPVFLNYFINNHLSTNYNYYYNFGFKSLGPLLYGFVNWLYKEFKEEKIEQVLFLARDGHIMKIAYDLLEFNTKIPSYYFEASRRSLRVPYYATINNLEELINNLSVPTVTSISQIFDSIGLDIDEYRNIIIQQGYELDESILRKDLLGEKFRNLYDIISKDIKNNALKEKYFLEKYIHQFDFSKKTAIVDIGWGASMQKYLLNSLQEMGKTSDIFGYYLGLTKKSRDNLILGKDKAKGYIFDNFNNNNEYEKERPFVGLFETLFLEPKGSVQKYIQDKENIVAVRYPYEYISNNRYLDEVEYVANIQKGAEKFVVEYSNSLIQKYITNTSSDMFYNLYEIGVSPKMKDVNKFGTFTFFNNGNKTKLASPDKIIIYILNPKKFIEDISNSQWKVGFLKKMLQIPLPYLKIFNLLQRMRGN